MSISPAKKQTELDFTKNYYLPARPYGFALFRWYFKLRVFGLEHIPAQGPVILVPNHSSFLDPPLLSSVVPRVVYFLMLHKHFYHSFFHWLFRRLPCIPVKRNPSGGAAFKLCIQALQHNQVLCVFPEGGISREHKSRGLRHGAALLALKTQAPLVPVGIQGASEALILNQWFPRPRPISIHFGKPITIPFTEEYNKDLLQKIISKVMDEVHLLLNGIS